MVEHGSNIALLIVLVGALTGVAALLRSALGRHVPPVVAYIAMGAIVGWVNVYCGLLDGAAREVLGFLGQLGVVTLLFRVGLGSNVRALLRQLRRATLVWVGGVTMSGMLGFAATRWLLGEGLVPSLFVGTALMATSVGVSVFVWREEGLLDTPAAGLMLDAAELDDISSVVLLAVLLHAAPTIAQGGAGIGPQLAVDVLSLLGRLVGLVLACVVFAGWLEAPLLRYLERIEGSTDRTLTVAAAGIVVAGLSGLLGFSIAIGAFFAGLTFSRDLHAHRIDARFDPIYHLFTPFFFIAVGLEIVPSAGLALPGIVAVLLLTAVIGKVVGHGVPALGAVSGWGALQIGVSMVPRAEIAMVVMQEGRRLGAWAVPAAMFSAMAVVSAVTCLFAPIAVRQMLRKHRPLPEEEP